MALNRRVGLGFTLSVDSTGGTSFTPLGAIIDGFKGPGAKVTTPDTTILADLYMTVGKSQVEPGDLSFSIMYDPDETTTTTLNAMLNSSSQVAPNWKITYPLGSQGSGTVVTETFKGILSGIDRVIKTKDAVIAEITVKVSGDPGYTHS